MDNLIGHISLRLHPDLVAFHYELNSLLLGPILAKFNFDCQICGLLSLRLKLVTEKYFLLSNHRARS